MSAPTIAASANALAEQIGSYAGYASIVGLGILALLYFAQAREVKRLREWAGRAPERAAELEQRVQADAHKRVVAQPIQPATAAAQQARTAAATAAVYASVGAQPPGAPPPPGQLARPATPAPGAPATPGTPAPGAPAPAPAPPAVGAPAPGTLPAAPAPVPAASAATQTPAAPAKPATSAPGAPPQPAPAPGARPIVTATPNPAPAPTPPAATAAARVATAARTVVPPANGTTNQDTAESAAARPEPAPYVPAGSQRRDGDDDGRGGLFGMSTGRVAMIIGGAVASIVVAVVLVLVLTGEEPAPPPNDFGNTPAAEEPAGSAGESERGTGSQSESTSSSTSAALTGAEKRATNVAVLNGTTQTGLARAVGDRIQQRGFTISNVATNADQSVPTTVVAYTNGHEEAALAVARIIEVDRGSVQAADVNTTVAADADVVVTVGSDKLG